MTHSGHPVTNTPERRFVPATVRLFPEWVSEFAGIRIIDFNMHKVLEYGVLGLCAIMTAYAVGIIYREQKRKERPRKAIMMFGYIFMSFCLTMAVLTAWVQTREPKNLPAIQVELAGQKAEVTRLQEELRSSNVDTIKQRLNEAEGKLAERDKEVLALKKQLDYDRIELSKAFETKVRVKTLARSLDRLLHVKWEMLIQSQHYPQEAQILKSIVTQLREMTWDLDRDPINLDNRRKAAVPQ